jgi:2-oxoglutarate dehydrogenase E2 component (dihydrolipoamide succinyltransferase)
MSTPIINPPQSAVLGLHRIEDRPVVRNGQIVIRPMMYSRCPMTTASSTAAKP